MDIKMIGVVGAGQMGGGISELAISSGFTVVMRDVTPEFVERGKKRIASDLERRVQKGKITAEEQKAVLGRLTTTTRLEDFKDCDLVIEAASEQIPIKKEVFQALDTITRKEAILASNTSSISITRIASFTKRPTRVVGMHFFIPPPVMKLLELVRGMETSEETFQAAKSVGLKMGKTPWEAKDFPGFISSRLIFNYMNEGVYALYEGVGTKEEIDNIMKMGANHPMGPIELADLVGLDTVLSVMKILNEAFGSRYHPCPLLTKYVEAGHLGVKTGRGFYDYGGRK
ncbi:MAG: 3-hydroxyacyl-CoA dehydrogenase family protein [Planctomycetaceae bacterium]